MKFFQTKDKVHLSPRLARKIGKQKDTLPRVAIVAVVALGLFLSGHIMSKGNGNLESSAQALEPGQVLGESKGIANYQVMNNDTLLSLSQKFGVYWMTIVEENELTPPYTLKPGQILRIPLPGGE